MRPLTLFAVFLTFALFPALAQTSDTPTTRIAFVNPDRLLAALPEGQAARALVQQRDDELQPLIEQLQALQTKVQSGESLTAEEQNQGELLTRTVEETRAQYQEDIQASLGDVDSTINDAIAQVAEANSFTLVLNGPLAGVSGYGLVVYGEPTPDITELVIEQLSG